MIDRFIFIFLIEQKKLLIKFNSKKSAMIDRLACFYFKLIFKI